MKLNENFKDIAKGVVFIISFVSFLWFGGVTLVEYSLMADATEKAAIVLDSDLRSSKMYIVAIKDHCNKDLPLSMKGNSKESLIEAGDSAMVLYDPDARGDCHLLYFFETDTLSHKRQAINELRERIPTPPKYRMSIWPPIIFISALLIFIYLLIPWLKEYYKIGNRTTGESQKDC